LLAPAGHPGPRAQEAVLDSLDGRRVEFLEKRLVTFREEMGREPTEGEAEGLRADVEVELLGKDAPCRGRAEFLRKKLADSFAKREAPPSPDQVEKFCGKDAPDLEKWKGLAAAIAELRRGSGDANSFFSLMVRELGVEPSKELRAFYLERDRPVPDKRVSIDPPSGAASISGKAARLTAGGLAHFFDASRAGGAAIMIPVRSERGRQPDTSVRTVAGAASVPEFPVEPAKGTLPAKYPWKVGRKDAGWFQRGADFIDDMRDMAFHSMILTFDALGAVIAPAYVKTIRRFTGGWDNFKEEWKIGIKRLAWRTETLGEPHHGLENLIHHQTGGTCAVVAQEMLLQAKGIRITEREAVEIAVKAGAYNTDGSRIACQSRGKTRCTLTYDLSRSDYVSKDDAGREYEPPPNALDLLWHGEATFRGGYNDAGGTPYSGIGSILAAKGFKSSVSMGYDHSSKMTVEEYLSLQRQKLVDELRDKNPVIITARACVLWGTPCDSDGFHAVLVTGAMRDKKSERVLGYWINDSGTNEGGRFVLAKDFEEAWKQSDLFMVYIDYDD